MAVPLQLRWQMQLQLRQLGVVEEQQGALTSCGAAQLQAQMQLQTRLQTRLRHLGLVEEQQGGGDVRGEGGGAPGPDAGADAGFI